MQILILHGCTSSDYIYIQAWGDSGQFENANFSIGLDRVKPDYYSVATMPFVNIQSQLDTVVVDTLFDGTNRLGTIYRYAEYFNGRYSFEIHHLSGFNYEYFRE